jgi:uncharacterized protein (TIGR00369 family)
MTPREIEAVMHAKLPISAAWGVRVLEAGEGRARLELPTNEALLRPGPTLCGPALMGLADMALWAALLGLNDGRDESLTAGLTIAFLRPAGTGAVIAEARLIKPRGRSLYGEVTLTRADTGAVCAHATSHWVSVGP